MSERVTSFTRPVVKSLRQAIKEALTEVEKNFAITLEFNTISFSPNEFSTRLKARVGCDSNEHDRNDWNKYCASFGFKPEHFGKSVRIGKDTFKIVGIKPRRAKYPILAQKNGGTIYKVSTSYFKQLIGDTFSFTDPLF